VRFVTRQVGLYSLIAKSQLLFRLDQGRALSNPNRFKTWSTLNKIQRGLSWNILQSEHRKGGWLVINNVPLKLAVAKSCSDFVVSLWMMSWLWCHYDMEDLCGRWREIWHGGGKGLIAYRYRHEQESLEQAPWLSGFFWRGFEVVSGLLRGESKRTKEWHVDIGLGWKNHFSYPPMRNLKLSARGFEILSLVDLGGLDLSHLFYKTSMAFFFYHNWNLG